MALWKISVKTTGTINGVRLEKGMFIEYVTNGSSNPLQVIGPNRDKIAQMFQNKYGVDLLKACAVNTGRLECVKI